MQELLEKILAKIKRSPHELQAYEDLYYMCLETKKTDIPLAVSYLKRAQSTVDTDSKVDPSTLKFKDTFGRGSFNKKERITSFKDSMKHASLQYFPVTGKYGSNE